MTTSYLRDSLSLFRYYKNLTERAMAQVTDEQLFAVLDGEMNCIAIIVKHMVGNMRSRWMDFLTSDGEKAGPQARYRVRESAGYASGIDESMGKRVELCVHRS